MDEFHAALMAWLIPKPLQPASGAGTGEDGAPAWWQGDDDAEAVTMAGVRTRAAATSTPTPRRRRGPR